MATAETRVLQGRVDGVLRSIVIAVGVALAYWALASFAIRFATVGPIGSTPTWPAAGLAVGCMLIWGRPAWIGTVLGILLTEMLLYQGWQSGSALTVAVLITAAAAGGKLLAVRLSHLSCGGRNDLDRVNGVLRLACLGGAVAQLPGALVCAAVLCLFGYAPWEAWARVAMMWWLGDMFGIIILAPLIVAFSVDRLATIQMAAERPGEALGLLLVSCLIGLATYDGSYAVDFTLLLPVIWAVFRFRAAGALAVGLLLVVIAFVGQTEGRGIFSQHSADDAFLLFQAFSAVMFLTVLLLNAVVREIEVAREALSAVNVRLEARIAERTRDLEEANRRLEQLSFTDGLTQVANRRSFEAALDREWRRLARGKQPLSLILMDVDYFKRLNDRHGHQAGDECLVRVAAAGKAVVTRATDLFARYGGEEFAVLLPATEAAGAARVAEDIRTAIERLGLPHGASDIAPHVTVSLGVATVVPGPGRKTADLIAAADGALYRAKAEGRNRYTVA